MPTGDAGEGRTRSHRESWRSVLDRRARTYLPILFADGSPLDLRILGRMLWRAALVGAAAGLLGAAFFAGVEYLQRLLLDELAGYSVLRAHGETFAAGGTAESFRPGFSASCPPSGGSRAGS